MKYAKKRIPMPPLGSSAVDVVLYLASIHHQAVNLMFLSYDVFPGLDKRAQKKLAQSELRILKKTYAIRKEHGFAFWDVLLTMSIRDGITPLQLLKECTFHPSSSQARFKKLSLNNISRQKINSYEKSISGKEMIGLCSLVELPRKKFLHIPMLDFHCLPKKENLMLVKSSLEMIGEKDGMILNSGRSYHYYGRELKTQEEWVDFLGRALLLSPIVDPRYIAHRLIDGWSILRIFANELKPKEPVVVGYL